jgi:streptogramin lyase
MNVRIITVGFALALGLAACGGGGGGGTPPVTRQTAGPATPTPKPTATPTPVPTQGPTAHFTISDPYSTTASSKRRPQYFSPATSAILITANGTSVQLNLSPSSQNCTVTGSNISCYVDIPVSNGPLTYSVKTLDSNGTALSQASGNATIKGVTTVPLAMQGIWKSTTARFSNEHPLMGSPSTITVAVSAYDADGALIIGPEPYSSPISLYDADTSGATSLSKTSVTYPGENVTLTYDGHSYVNAIVATGTPGDPFYGQQDMLVPSIPATEYAVPSGSITATNGGHGRMIVNADNTISFIEQNAHLGRVTMSGTVTETTLPHYYYDIAKGTDGNLWAIAQTGNAGDNNALERINSDGTVTLMPTFPYYTWGDLTLGSDGNFWAGTGVGTGGPTAGVERVTPAGVETTFTLTGVTGIGDAVLGSDGNIWFVGSAGYYATEFVSVKPDGTFAQYPAPAADLGCCNGMGNIAAGPDGQLYSVMSQLVERSTTSGVFSNLPVSPYGQLNFFDYYGQNANSPLGFGPDGALWISGPGNAYCNPQVERITTSGSYAILQLPITCSNLNGPAPGITSFVIGPDGNLWYTRDKYVGKIIPQ